jgi:peptidyl-prolyl cis-trans isomerase A (cyclophilin A)
MFCVRCLSFVLVCLALVGCGKKEQPAADVQAASSPPAASGASDIAAAQSSVGRSKPVEEPPADPTAVIHTSQGDITLRLFQAKAPRTVENFLRNYAERGFYNETIFHHLEPGQMLIGGAYTASLEPKPARAAIYNESRNGLSNRRGTIAMIREPEAPHTATSEFFINLADNTHLDCPAESDEAFGYCVFGEVISGMDVVEKISKLETTPQGDFPRVPSPVARIETVERLR